jgi:tetratricopeptide (TPR) repeat protein
MGRWQLAAAVVLVIVTLAVYWPVGHYPFVGYDDGFYVTENPQVAAGLSWAGVRWAFTTFHEANWHPLTWLSHQLDATLFGLDAGGHHRTNLLLHAGNGLLLGFLLLRLTGSLWPSTAVAALFALHPLNVESVAWVAERKNLLSTLLFLLALLAYRRYIRQPGAANYLLVALLFALGLLAKPMLVTFPCVLLLLDWWPLGRVAGSGVPAAREDAAVEQRRWSALVREKVPLFLLAAAASVVTLVAQRSEGAVVARESLGYGLRLANALVAYVAYLAKAIWPTELAPLYPFPTAVPAWQWGGAQLLLAGLTAAAFRLRRRAPCLLAGWLWYLGTLVPVIGLVQVGQQAMADRYAYLPFIGLFGAVAGGVAELVRGRRHRQLLAGAILAGALLLLALQTRHQLFFWRDTETLVRHTLAVTRDNFVMHHNLGNELERQGRFAEALAEQAAAAALRPGNAESRFFLANALYAVERYEDAVREYRIALKLKPEYPAAHNNLGAALHRLGRRDEALSHYAEALRLDPADAKARHNLEELQRELPHQSGR